MNKPVYLGLSIIDLMCLTVMYAFLVWLRKTKL